MRRKAVAKLCEWPTSRSVSDSSRYIRSNAQYAARRLVEVKDGLPKGAEGFTGHSHASPSHDGAARTASGRMRLEGGYFSHRGRVKHNAEVEPVLQMHCITLLVLQMGYLLETASLSSKKSKSPRPGKWRACARAHVARTRREGLPIHQRSDKGLAALSSAWVDAVVAVAAPVCRGSLCGKQGHYGRPARSKRLIGRGAILGILWRR